MVMAVEAAENGEGAEAVDHRENVVVIAILMEDGMKRIYPAIDHVIEMMIEIVVIAMVMAVEA